MATAERETKTVTWHGLDVRALCDKLRTDPDRGLKSAEAAARLAQHGPNALSGKRRQT